MLVSDFEKVRNLPLRITLIYLGFSLLWIIGSDSLVKGLFASDHPNFTFMVSLGKGTFFVLVTAMLLFITMTRGINAMIKAEIVAREARSNLEAKVLSRTSELNQKIQELEQAKLAREESEALFRTMADNVPVLIWLTGPNGERTFFNRSWQNFTGRPMDSDLGWHWTTNIHPDDLHYYLALYRHALQQHRNFSAEYRLKRADGTYRWAISKASPHWGGGGQFLGFIGSCIDIDEHKEMEEKLQKTKESLQHELKIRQEEMEYEVKEREEVEKQLLHSQKLEAIGRLTGGIAHDFNNLLTVIINSLEEVAEGKTSPEISREYLNIAAKSAYKGAELVQRLLVFSRKKSPATRLLDLAESLPAMMEVLNRALGPDIKIELRLPPVGEAIISVDPSQLENVLINLAINSRDAMPKGGEIAIEVHILPQSRLEILFRDNGQGIPAAVLGKVFEPFFTTKEPGKGSGLGLSMVYSFVESNGGKINLTSAENKGTEFQIILPRSTSGGQTKAKPLVYPIVEGHGERLLVVDDSPEVLRLTILRLQELGYDPIPCQCAEEALEIFKQDSEFVLIMADVNLGQGMDGVELVRVLHKTHPQLKAIFTTGYPDHPSLHGTMIPVLYKPYAKPDISYMVGTVLKE